MREHRRRRTTKGSAATPLGPEGCGGTPPSSALRLLDDAGHRLVAAPGIRARRARNKRHRIYGRGVLSPIVETLIRAISDTIGILRAGSFLGLQICRVRTRLLGQRLTNPNTSARFLPGRDWQSFRRLVEGLQWDRWPTFLLTQRKECHFHARSKPTVNRSQSVNPR